MESLSDKLRALGIKPGNQVTAPPPRSSEDDFSKIIPGETLQNSLGSYYLSTTDLPRGYKHGCVEFDQPIQADSLSSVTKNPTEPSPAQSLFFLDTETTGLSGGTGTLAFLIGLGYQTENSFRVDQYLVRNPLEEPAMLLAVANFIESMSCVATFNGKAFDIPLMNNRYVVNRIPKPFGNLYHLDLLHISRRIWKNRLQSRALQDLEREILEIPRDENEVPGWMIPEIYFEYQRTQDPSRLAGVLYHNRMDILSLAALTAYLDKVLKNIEEEKFQINSLDLFSIGRIYDECGFKEQAEKIFIECITNNDLEDTYYREANFRLGLIFKKNDRWDDALNAFTIASYHDDYCASIELAKYYEHQVSEMKNALYWVRISMDQINSSNLPRYKKNQLLKSEHVREARLQQKLSKGLINEQSNQR